MDNKRIIIVGGYGSIPLALLTREFGLIESVRFSDGKYLQDSLDFTYKRPRKHTDVPFWCKKHK